MSIGIIFVELVDDVDLIARRTYSDDGPDDGSEQAVARFAGSCVD